jgi:hypothetical protein
VGEAEAGDKGEVRWVPRIGAGASGEGAHVLWGRRLFLACGCAATLLISSLSFHPTRLFFPLSRTVTLKQLPLNFSQLETWFNDVYHSKS